MRTHAELGGEIEECLKATGEGVEPQVLQRKIQIGGVRKNGDGKV